MSRRRVFQIRNCSAEQFRRFLQLSERLIARRTEKPAHSAGRMVVVDTDPVTSNMSGSFADCALSILKFIEHDVGSGQKTVGVVNLGVAGLYRVSMVFAKITGASVFPSSGSLTPRLALGVQAHFADVIATIAKVAVADKILQRFDDLAVCARLCALCIRHDFLAATVLLSNRARLARGVMPVPRAFAVVKIFERFVFSANPARFPHRPLSV